MLCCICYKKCHDEVYIFQVLLRKISIMLKMILLSTKYLAIPLSVNDKSKLYTNENV